MTLSVTAFLCVVILAAIAGVFVGAWLHDSREYARGVARMQWRFGRGIRWQEEQEAKEAHATGERTRAAVLGKANW